MFFARKGHTYLILGSKVTFAFNIRGASNRIAGLTDAEKSRVCLFCLFAFPSTINNNKNDNPHFIR